MFLYIVNTVVNMETSQPQNSTPEAVLGLNEPIITVLIARVKFIYIVAKSFPKMAQ